MPEPVRRMTASLRCWLTAIGVVAIIAADIIGVSNHSADNIALIIGALVVGDSYRKV